MSSDSIEQKAKKLAVLKAKRDASQRQGMLAIQGLMDSRCPPGPGRNTEEERQTVHQLMDNMVQNLRPLTNEIEEVELDLQRSEPQDQQQDGNCDEDNSSEVDKDDDESISSEENEDKSTSLGEDEDEDEDEDENSSASMKHAEGHMKGPPAQVETSSTESVKSTGPPHFDRNTEVIVPRIMDFLGVRSLVALSLTSKRSRVLLNQEVTRRKKRFEECEAQLKALLEDPCSREDYDKAKDLYNEAKSLIHSGYEYDYPEILVDSWIDAEVEGPPPEKFRSPLFEHEHQRIDPESNDDYPPFALLPDSFYVPSSDVQPSKEMLVMMDWRALWLWGEEDHMSRMYESFDYWDPYYRDPKHAFRKFEAKQATYFRGLMWHLIRDLLADDEHKEAFRVAARKLALIRIHATDTLHYVLYHMDAGNDEK